MLVMPGLTQTRDAAVALLKAALPDMRVEGIAGATDATSILREPIGAGAIFVMALSSVNVASEDSLDFDLQGSLAALIVVHGRKNKTARESDGLALAEKVALALHGNSFGLTGVSPARCTGLAPVEDDDMDARGVWAWGVTWEQRIIMGVA